MIIDLPAFIEKESRYWKELEVTLANLDRDSFRQRDLAFFQRLFYLTERAAADLARLRSFSGEQETQRYLEDLVARAYSEMHDSPDRSRLPNPWTGFVLALPAVFRRHFRYFKWSLAATCVGALFGIFALLFDPSSKGAMMPFSHLLGDPSDRVAMEESGNYAQQEGKTSFSAQLMTHNTRVSIFTLALGMTYAIGTFVVLFYNGAIIGAVALDYVRAGETIFLAGWLLPHGSVEIPAILIAGQAGILVGRTLLGNQENRLPLTERFRAIRSDLLVLVGGIGCLLIWAGLIEAFFSQHHEPALPYALKIAFGGGQLVLLFLYLGLAGRRPGTSKPTNG